MMYTVSFLHAFHSKIREHIHVFTYIDHSYKATTISYLYKYARASICDFYVNDSEKEKNDIENKSTVKKQTAGFDYFAVCFCALSKKYAKKKL